MNISLKIQRTARLTFGSFWRLFRGFQKLIIKLGRPLFITNPSQKQLLLEKLGSNYGGWKVPVQLITKEWICYCFGVGNDATFDMALAKRFNCQVFSFDPTPTALNYIEKVDYNKNLLHFYPWGIWKEDKKIKFYAAVNPRDSNFSVFDLHGSGEFVVAQCYKLSSIMSKLGHKKIDLLKLDIEGSWYEVINQILGENISISVLCAEFDSPVSLLRVRRVVSALECHGLVLVDYEKNNYVFVKLDGSDSQVL